MLPFADKDFSAFAVSPTRELFVAAPIGSSPEIWEIPDPEADAESVGMFLNMTMGEDMREGVRMSGSKFRTGAMAFSNDGSRFATGSSTGRTAVFDAASAEQLWLSQARPGAVGVVAFSPDGRWLASASAEGLMSVYQVSSGEEWHLEGTGSQITGAAFTPNSELLVFARADGPALFVDVKARALLRAPAQSPEAATCVAINSSGTKIAVGTPNGQIQIWSIE